MFVLSASVPGTRHTLPGQPAWKNNQDAYCVLRPTDDSCVAIICDGCGSGNRSEVGAALGARKCAELLAEELRDGRETREEIRWAKVKLDLIGYITAIAAGLGGDLTATIEEYFLFTIVSLVVTSKEVCVARIGDGVFAVYDSLRNDWYEFGPFPNNAPPYLMYNVTGSPIFEDNPSLKDFQIISRPRKGVEVAVIGCDGVSDLWKCGDALICLPGTDEPIKPVWEVFNRDFFKAPDNLRRYLAKINRETSKGGRVVSGHLPDDTTMVAVWVEE